MERYRASERSKHQPPTCPACHATVDQAWIEVTTRQDPEPMFTPGRWVCRTPGCRYEG